MQRRQVFLERKEFESIKSHAKNAKTQSFLGCKAFKNLIFYRLHTLYYLCVLALFARNSLSKIFFRYSCVEQASYRVVDVKYHAKNAKTQSFLGCKEFKSISYFLVFILFNIFASLRTLREIFYPRDQFVKKRVKILQKFRVY